MFALIFCSCNFKHVCITCLKGLCIFVYIFVIRVVLPCFTTTYLFYLPTILKETPQQDSNVSGHVTHEVRWFVGWYDVVFVDIFWKHDLKHNIFWNRMAGKTKKNVIHGTISWPHKDASLRRFMTTVGLQWPETTLPSTTGQRHGPIHTDNV